MNDLQFNSEMDLYKRLKPALITKKRECDRLRLHYISEADIWNYLKRNVWQTSTNLELSNMVHDILNADVNKIDRTLKTALEKEVREPDIYNY